MEIAILLATYNGENYLHEQLQSLANQTNQNWKIYLRDDCSTDTTLEIITDFQNKYPNKIVILNNGNLKLGAKKSFIALLDFAQAEYYMFCDQDDVWLPNKVEKSLLASHLLEKKTSQKSILVFCDAKVVDDKLNVISESFWKTTKTNPNFLIKRKRFQVFNCAPGCTMFFNHSLKMKLFPFPEKAPMHDWWVAILAQRIGVIIPLEESLILYRQHSNNTIGADYVNKNYFLSKLYNITKSYNIQKNHLEFIREINGINILQFIWIKFSYTIKRFISN